MAALCASIKENGMVNPCQLGHHRGQYYMLCGGQRLKAAKKIGMELIPCAIRDMDDQDWIRDNPQIEWRTM